MTSPDGAAAVTPSALDTLAEAIEERYGLSLRACTPEGIEQRLRYRLFDRAFRRVEDYAEYLVHAGDPSAWEALLETLTTNDSRLFGWASDFLPLFEMETNRRWARHFDRTAGAPPFRCLSAGCGSGQEAYSIAMALEEVRERLPSFTYEVVGVDLSARAIGAARAALYPRGHAEAMPAEWRERYLVDEGDSVRVGPIRARTRFARANLVAREALAPLGAFDLVFARGVMAVLTPSGRAAAMGNLTAALAPGGVLLLGPGETASGAGVDLDLRPIRWGERRAYERAAGEGAELPGEDRRPERGTALIAHRSELKRAWLRLLLESRDYRVAEAPDALSALEIAVEGPVRERYLLEPTLPGGGGAYVAERVAALGGLTPGSVRYLGSAPAAGDPAPVAAGPGGAAHVPLPLSEEDLDSFLGFPEP